MDRSRESYTALHIAFCAVLMKRRPRWGSSLVPSHCDDLYSSAQSTHMLTSAHQLHLKYCAPMWCHVNCFPCRNSAAPLSVVSIRFLLSSLGAHRVHELLGIYISERWAKMNRQSTSFHSTTRSPSLITSS